jgi:16S rRNA (guanine966-N2)-methyltransferase
VNGVGKARQGGLRVIAGEFGGRRIAAPPGRGTRPTADRVREALFSIVGPVDGLNVLDLFAGSGALGIEALSRGAATATFVESDHKAQGVIRQNLAVLGITDRSRVVAADWRQTLMREDTAGSVFGLCLIDPPYTLLIKIFDELGPLLVPVLAPGARIVIERSSRTSPPEFSDLDITSRIDRDYGDTALSVLTLSGGGR